MIETSEQISNILYSVHTYIINKQKIMKEEQKKKIEYIIGIDLGHGETSAAICPM